MKRAGSSAIIVGAIYSKGLIAPYVVRKTTVQNAIRRYYPAIGIAPPYLA